MKTTTNALVVMLSQKYNKDPLIGYPCIATTTVTNTLIFRERHSITENYNKQYLHFVSNERAKEYEYAYHDGFVFQMDDAEWRKGNKVIACTNPELKLPLIPEEWIRTKYVPSNGVIKEVRLETQEYWEEGHGGEFPAKKLKLTSNNEVVIVDETNEGNPPYSGYGKSTSIPIDQELEADISLLDWARNSYNAEVILTDRQRKLLNICLGGILGMDKEAVEEVYAKDKKTNFSGEEQVTAQYPEIKFNPCGIGTGISINGKDCTDISLW